MWLARWSRLPAVLFSNVETNSRIISFATVSSKDTTRKLYDSSFFKQMEGRFFNEGRFTEILKTQFWDACQASIGHSLELSSKTETYAANLNVGRWSTQS